MRTHRLLAVVAVAMGAFGVAAAVQAAIPDGSGVIHGCYSKSAAPGSQPGALRVIDTAAGQSCQLSESAVNWSQTGPQGPLGPQGPKGATGPQGPKGDKGDPGANAYFAGTGLTQTGGNTFNISGGYRLPQGCGEGQAPAIVSFTWTCTTLASAGENCANGKFVNGVNSTGDLTCATPGSAGPSLWRSPLLGHVNTPQDQDTIIATLSLPAGNFLVDAAFNAADDIGGNGNVKMGCVIDQGYGQEAEIEADAVFVPAAMHYVVVLSAPTDVNAICHDRGGSDGVDYAFMTALALGPTP